MSLLTGPGDDKSGTTATLCVRRAQFWDAEAHAFDPAKAGVCSNYLCDAMPGDESSKALQKMMRLMPVVSDVVGPALEAHGFGKEDLMTVTAQMQGLGAEDPSITADTMKLMDAVTQGKIEPLFA